jgi:hypothetical protein
MMEGSEIWLPAGRKSYSKALASSPLSSQDG